MFSPQLPPDESDGVAGPPGQRFRQRNPIDTSSRAIELETPLVSAVIHGDRSGTDLAAGQLY